MALDEPGTTPVSNPTIRTQMAHRTIRAFTEEPLGEETVTTLLEVARHTATSAFYQQFTIIRVLDPAVREQIHLASGQPYVGGTRGELWVFVLDLARNAAIREQAGASLEPLSRMNAYQQGAADTLLAAQNVVVAAESLGLGTVYLGSIGADPRRVIRALGLPRLTYPLLGLLIGHPTQEPQYKPRLPLSVTVGVDSYPALTDPAEQLAEYDAQVREYYDLRDSNNRIDSFTHQIATKLGTGGSELSPVLEVLHEQGLALR